MLAIDPPLFADVTGSTDTEVVFYLALTFGLEDDPIQALERTVGLIESVAGRRGRRWFRGASACRTARPCGRCAMRPREPRAPCSPPPTRTQSGAVSRQRPASAAHRRRPSGRLGAVLGPSWTLERGSRGDAVTVRHRGELDERPFRPSPADARRRAGSRARRQTRIDELSGRGQPHLDRALVVAHLEYGLRRRRGAALDRAVAKVEA